MKELLSADCRHVALISNRCIDMRFSIRNPKSEIGNVYGLAL